VLKPKKRLWRMCRPRVEPVSRWFRCWSREYCCGGQCAVSCLRTRVVLFSDTLQCIVRGNRKLQSGTTTGTTTYNPVAEYAAGMSAGVAIIAVVGGLIVLVGLGVCFYYFNRKSGVATTPSERIVVLLYRVGVLRVALGAVGIISSMAFFTCALSIGGGVVAILTMKSLPSAIEIGHRRVPSRVRPIHSANLAIAAAAFAGEELIFFIAIYISQVTRFFSGLPCSTAGCATAFTPEYMTYL
jgi:hypothetical protein